MNKLEVKNTGYVLENLTRTIVMTDENGVEFRINFLKGGGISVNKFEGGIIIEPRVTNEIYIK